MFFFFLKTCPFDMFVIWISTVFSGWGGRGGGGGGRKPVTILSLFSTR